MCSRRRRDRCNRPPLKWKPRRHQWCYCSWAWWRQRKPSCSAVGGARGSLGINRAGSCLSMNPYSFPLCLIPLHHRNAFPFFTTCVSVSSFDQLGSFCCLPKLTGSQKILSAYRDSRAVVLDHGLMMTGDGGCCRCGRGKCVLVRLGDVPTSALSERDTYSE